MGSASPAARSPQDGHRASSSLLHCSASSGQKQTCRGDADTPRWPKGRNFTTPQCFFRPCSLKKGHDKRHHFSNPAARSVSRSRPRGQQGAPGGNEGPAGTASPPPSAAGKAHAEPSHSSRSDTKVRRLQKPEADEPTRVSGFCSPQSVTARRRENVLYE